VRSIIVDSGALVALFDRSDRYAKTIKASLARAPAAVTLLTTWPCVTEATHILGRLDLQLALLAFLHSGRCSVRDFATVDLAWFMAWMRKYSGRRGMDLADASLVWLAGESDTTEVLTTDRSDFERYRTPAGKPFRLV
jgi:predicted nucleic acid-binding protein